MGGQRWLKLGFVKVQPSEFSEIIFSSFYDTLFSRAQKSFR